MQRGLAIAGLVVLLAGLGLGFVPQSANGINCGSTFVASDDARVADLARTLGGAPADGLEGPRPYENACIDRRGGYWPIAWVLLLVGGALFVPTVVTAASPDSTNRPSRP
jgi:hypothetical protein